MDQPNHQPPAGLATSAEIEDESLTEDGSVTEGEVQVAAAILRGAPDRDGPDLAREVLLAATWVRGHPERVEEAIARTSVAANPWRACFGVLAGAIALTALIWGLLTHRLPELVDHLAYPRLGWVLVGAVGVMVLDAWVDDLGTCWHTIRARGVRGGGS